MKYTIYYKHTFGCDVVTAKNEKQARKKALKLLKKDFKWFERFLIPFGMNVNNCGKVEKIHSLKELIEEIEICEEED